MKEYSKWEKERFDRIKNGVKKSKSWIENNISYDHFKKKSLINDKKLDSIVRAIEKNKITAKKVEYLLTITGYSYSAASIMRHFYPNIIIPSPDIERKGLVKYYIFSNENNIFISFRGTKTFGESINNLKFYRVKFDLLEKNDFIDFIQWRDNIIQNNNFNNLRTPLAEDKDIEIHQGFLNEATAVYKEIINNLSLLINPSCKKTNIILCGHSLGGPIATIVSMFISYFLRKAVLKNKIEINLVTTNGPPIGNKNFNLLLPYLGIKNYIRFYNYQDFIPYYGYYGSWVDSKKFRHLDFMLNNGLNSEDKLEGRTIKNRIHNTNIFVKDFGKNLEPFLSKIKIDKKSLIQKKFIFHDFFQINKKEKVFFI